MHGLPLESRSRRHLLGGAPGRIVRLARNLLEGAHAHAILRLRLEASNLLRRDLRAVHLERLGSLLEVVADSALQLIAAYLLCLLLPRGLEAPLQRFHLRRLRCLMKQALHNGVLKLCRKRLLPELLLKELR